MIEFIEVLYYRQRIHSRLSHVSPYAFEAGRR